MNICDRCDNKKSMDELVKQNEKYICNDCIVDQNNEYYFGESMFFGTEKTEEKNTAGLLNWIFG